MSEVRNYQKLVTDCKIHLKQALLDVLHNKINANEVRGIPSIPEELYTFLKKEKRRIEKNNRLYDDQKAILFPSNTTSVDSQNFDVTVIRLLIHEFCNITNAKGNKGQPDDNDTTLWAYVCRATKMRNEICHYGNIMELNDETYKNMWGKTKDILDGLKYEVDSKVFLQHLKDYKKYSSENTSKEFFIERRLSVKKNKNKRVIFYGEGVTELGQVLDENDRVIIYGEAGIGKTATARKIKHDWSKEKILPKYYLLYFKSKTINQEIKYYCYEAPFFFSEIGEGKGKTDQNFLYHDCVTRPIDDLFILVDGVDEFPIKNLLNQENVDKLEIKVRNNEKITAAETIYAIYFGFLFPESKICLLGRNGEFQKLKEVEDKKENSIFNTSDRETADLELLELNEVNIKDFTCFKICNQVHTGACEKIYDKLKDIDLCKVPTDLNSCLELLKEQPNKDIGRITRTKILIATLHNRLNKHIYKRINKRCKSFREIRDEKIFDEYLECIGDLAEISFNALLKRVVTVEGVKEESGYLEDKNHIKIKRTCLEELDIFYIRDDVYDLTLEPYHTLSIEFLTACYLFSHPAKWDSILKLTKDRKIVIIAFIAGLHARNKFTNDFVRNVFKTSDYSLGTFFSWLYENVENELSSPRSGSENDCNFLMPNQQMSPPIGLLEYISHEVEVPQTFISSTIIVDSYFDLDFYNLKYIKHSFFTKVSDNLDLDSFLDRFPKYNFIIMIENVGMDDESFSSIKKYKENSRVLFRTRSMYFIKAFKSLFDLELSLYEIKIKENVDTRSITKLLNAVSSPSPNIRCKDLMFEDIAEFNKKQIRQLFAICLDGKVQSISLSDNMFTAEQIKMLKIMESRLTTEQINLRMCHLDFRHVLDLPNLGNRNLLLIGTKNVNDDNLREFRKHFIPRACSNLSKYKILSPWDAFDRKSYNSQKNETLISLRLLNVDFTNVTPEVFASTFRLIPSLACTDNYDYIPSTHWKCLSEAKGCQINELRIWYPKSNNYVHFMKIKLKMIQFVCGSKDELKELLNHIVRSPNVQLDKKIKVFRVSFYEYSLEKYEEVTLFSRETIEEYKENCILDDSRIDEAQQTFYEGEKFNKYWCCEISMPLKKTADLCVIDCCDDNENSVKEIEDELSAIPKSDESENANSLSDNESVYEKTDNSEIESLSSYYESSNEESEDELNDGNCSILKKCCCCFPKL